MVQKNRLTRLLFRQAQRVCYPVELAQDSIITPFQLRWVQPEMVGIRCSQYRLQAV
jgi:hypothetical protein